jgi:hypothetical protein
LLVVTTLLLLLLLMTLLLLLFLQGADVPDKARIARQGTQLLSGAIKPGRQGGAILQHGWPRRIASGMMHAGVELLQC